MGTSMLVYMGLFDPSVQGDLEIVMQENNQMFFGNMINAVNNMKINYDHLTDSRNQWELGVKAVDARLPTEPKDTGLYSASNSVTQIDHHPAGVKNFSFVSFRFQIASFVSRDIILRNKYIVEVVSEVGGAWASATLILSFFFFQKFEKKTVFRLKPYASKVEKE